MESHHPAGTWRKKQRCFPAYALLHLSMLLGLWRRRLSWCPQRCFTRVIFVRGKWNTLPLYHQEGHVSLITIIAKLPVFLGTWRSGESLFSALLGKSRTGSLLTINRWAAEEIHFSSAGASQLNAEFPFFQCRHSVSSWRSENSVWVVLLLCNSMILRQGIALHTPPPRAVVPVVCWCPQRAAEEASAQLL